MEEKEKRDVEILTEEEIVEKIVEDNKERELKE